MKFVNTLQNILQDKRIADYISSFEGSDIYFAASIIGEAINYCIIHQTDKNIKTEEVLAYIKVVNGIKLKASAMDKDIRDEFFQTERAKIIAATIAKSLKINLKTASDSEISKIKEYFLKNYMEEGYVFHSFPTARQESVKQNGFTTIQKLWDNEAVKRISKILESHGAIAAMGGLTYYNPNGMYVEHNAEKVFFHCLSAPEWFKFFTSSEHNGTSFDVSTSPFYVKNYAACKINVEKLSENLNLNTEESKEVLDLFESTWSVLKEKIHTLALIKRKTVGKINPISENEDLLTTIVDSLTDKSKQFTEHVGSVVNPQQIAASDVELLQIPAGENFLKCSEFHTETKEELFDPKKNISLLCRGLISGAIHVTYEQYSSCMNAIEQTFSNNETKLSELNKRINQMYERIRTCALNENQKQQIIDMLKDYENRRKLKNNLSC